MKARTRAAFTLVELLTVIAIIGLLISILLPSLGRAREMAHRTACLANQSIIMKGVLVYAKDADGKFPNWGQQYPGFVTMGKGWDWDGTDNTAGWMTATKYHNLATDTTSITSNTRNYYILVRKKLADTKNFQCHSDPDFQGFFNPADPNKTWDFQFRGQVSFSMQYQGPAFDSSSNAIPGWQTSIGDDPRMVVLADKSPFIRPKPPIQAYAVDTGYGFEVPKDTDADTYGQFCKFLKTVETNAGLDPTTGKFKPNLANPDDVQALNSQNHKGEGQNVTRLDGSGAFAEDPWQGAAGDNIYTVQDGRPGSIDAVNNVLVSHIARACGAYPSGAATVAGPGDGGILGYWMMNSRYSKTNYPDSFLVP